jgi:hypothetical protein
MRVSGEEAAVGRRAAEPAAGRSFDAALRRADGREVQERQVAGRREASGPEAQGRRGSSAPVPLASAGAGHSGRGARGTPASTALDDTCAPPLLPPPGTTVAPPLAPAASPAGAVTLALAVRAVVPAVEAFRLGGREALTLDFGRALGVEVRAVPGGVTVTLATPPGLLPAARTELPGLLRALAARGVNVLHADVRERGRQGCGR